MSPSTEQQDAANDEQPATKKSKVEQQGNREKLKELEATAKSLGIDHEKEEGWDQLVEIAKIMILQKEIDLHQEKIKNKALENDLLQEKIKTKTDLHQKEKIIKTLENDLKTLEKDLFPTSFERLLKNKPKLKLKCMTQSSHTGAACHSPAEAQELENSMDTLKLLEINQELYKNTCSALLMKFTAGGHNCESKELFNDELIKDVYTESDVSHYISAALDDAMTLASKACGRKLEVHHEYSLFSGRPDHLVVHEKDTQTPVMVVEDKKPNGSDILTKYVVGQVYDYMMDLRWFGQVTPVVVLSTFESSWLFFEGSETTESIARKFPFAGNDQSFNSPGKGKAKNDDKTPSPPVLIMEDHNQFEADSLFHPCPERKLVRSTEYGSGQLVNLLFTAILYGLSQNSKAQKKKLRRHKGGYKGVALRFSKEEYSWGDLNCPAGFRIYEKEAQNTTRRIDKRADPGIYFAIDSIGRGATSKVFLALDHMGKECVIKMYVRREKKSNDQLESLTEAKKKGGKMCTIEAKRLVQFYNCLDGLVSHQVLYGFPCVVMPFFKPLTKAERDEALNDGSIKKCLEELKGKSLKYRDCDVRWRHIGIFEHEKKGKHIILYDLAELEEVDSNPNDNVVSNQLKTLQARHREGGPISMNE